MTKGDGDEWEHMEYTAYGEQWIDEGSDRSVIGYRFTSKEWDSETGLYYFGARYMDPTTSRWMSADPDMGKYLPATPIDDNARKSNGNLPGEGGVFNFLNLAVYHYAANNPIRYNDPTGKEDAGATIPLLSKLVKQSDPGLSPSGGASACNYRAIQAGAELALGKALKTGEINTTTSQLSQSESGALGPEYYVNKPGAVLTETLKTLGRSDLTGKEVGRGYQRKEEIPKGATFTVVRGTMTTTGGEKVEHSKLGDPQGNVIWNPSESPGSQEMEGVTYRAYVIGPRISPIRQAND